MLHIVTRSDVSYTPDNPNYCAMTGVCQWPPLYGISAKEKPEEKPEESSRNGEDLRRRGESVVPQDVVETQWGCEKAGGDKDPVGMLPDGVVADDAAKGALDESIQSMSAPDASRNAETLIEPIVIHRGSINYQRASPPDGEITTPALLC